MLDGLARHRVPDQGEPLPPQLIGERQRIGGGLAHGEFPGHVLARAVPAQVHERPGVLVAVQVIGQRAPSPGGPKPPVQREYPVLPDPTITAASAITTP